MKPGTRKYAQATPEQKETVLKLFLAGGDNRTGTIAGAVGLSPYQVSKILDEYFLQKKSLTYDKYQRKIQ